MALCLSARTSVRYSQIFCRNGRTDLAYFSHTAYARIILRCYKLITCDRLTSKITVTTSLCRSLNVADILGHILCLSHILHHDLHCSFGCSPTCHLQTVHDCMHGLAPKYLAELCVPVADVAGRRQLRSASRGLLNIPRYNMSNYGRRAFCFAGPYVWNSLPEHIRQSTSIAVLKRSLKTFLLQQISHLAH